MILEQGVCMSARVCWRMHACWAIMEVCACKVSHISPFSDAHTLVSVSQSVMEKDSGNLTFIQTDMTADCHYLDLHSFRPLFKLRNSSCLVACSSSHLSRKQVHNSFLLSALEGTVFFYTIQQMSTCAWKYLQKTHSHAYRQKWTEFEIQSLFISAFNKSMWWIECLQV